MAKVVSVSKLKASLSSYMEHVKSGEEVLVTERGKPIARVVPCRPSDVDVEQLIRDGILLPGDPVPLPDDFWDSRLKDPEGKFLRALLAEREEARY